MKKRNTHLFTILLGVLILIAGIRGLMGIISYGFIPHELYVAFGLVAISYGLWKFFTADENGGEDE